MGMDKVKAGARRHQQWALRSLKNIVSGPLAIIINPSFEHHVPIETLGEGTPTTLPKPKKSTGLPTKPWPIVLLNSIRKSLSIITLRLITDKIDCFTGPYHCGFKRGRSCADNVWAQPMLISVVITRKWDFHEVSPRYQQVQTHPRCPTTSRLQGWWTKTS